jgi:nicotinamidase-related amidase
VTRRGLLLIDFQHDFLDPDGRMPVEQRQVESVIAAARRAVDAAQARGDLIVKIGNEFRRGDLIGNLLRHHASIRGSSGCTWDRRIDPPGAAYLPKWRSSAFSNPALARLLQNSHVGAVSLTGLYTKACISATAKAARKQGLSVQVIGDATACSSDESRRTALDKLHRIGIDIV